MTEDWNFPVRKLNENINATLSQLLRGREKHFRVISTRSVSQIINANGQWPTA